jgi:ethylbenzene dioxygenase ferredoxin subunit
MSDGDRDERNIDFAPIRLCRADEVKEGQPLKVDPAGLSTLAVYSAEGRYYVTDAFCTHGRALLSDGYQEGFIIECPLHGGSFDVRSGAPLTPPCQLGLRTYSARLAEGWISIARPVAEER